MLNKLFRRRPLIEELEPRILFSADLAPFALDSLAPAPEQRVINTEGEFSSVAATTRHELVIIDTGVADYETLLSDILDQAGSDRHFSVVILDAQRDGIEQISDILKQTNGLDAVHLISHGGSGVLQLGSSQLDAASLDSRAGEIAAWGSAFNADGDLLIYGCDVAAGVDGEAFLNALSKLTGADVAASNNTTGIEALGGDWTLEFNTGRIESPHVIDKTGQLTWAGTLAVTQSGVSSAASVGAVSSLSFAHTINAGSDRLLIVEVVIGNGSDSASVTYNGTPLTLLTGVYAQANAVKVELWYLVAPPVGTSTVDITIVPTWGAQKVVAGAATFYGVDQASPLGTPATGKNNNAEASLTLPSVSGDMVIDVAGALGVSSSTVGADQTLLFTQKNGSTATDVWGVSSTEPGAASVVMSEAFTNSSGRWAAIAVAVKQVGSPANTAPLATNLSAAESYTEDTPLNLIDIVISDADSADVSVTLTLSNAGAGSLNTGTSGGTTSTYNIGTGVWSASGTIADVNALLAGLTFTPTLNFNSNFSIATSVSDGMAAPVTGNKAITGIAVNDPPINTVPGSQTVAKNATLVFSAANGNAFSISDVDAGGASVQTTIVVPNGVLNAGAGTTGVTVSGTGTNTVTLTGTLTQINNLLAGNLGGSLSYTPNTGFTGSVTLQFSTNDQNAGASGSGGAKSDTDVVAISVTDASLWLSTEGSATSSAGSGNLSWNDGRVVNFGNPNLILGSGTTSGTFSSALDFNALGDGNVDVTGLHYVSQAVTVGTTVPFSLLAGDILFSVDGNETFSGLNVTKQDVVLFRPTTPGDFSSGSFQIVLRNPGGTGNDVRDFALVEAPVTVGGTALQKGDFLLLLSGGSYDKDVWLFRATTTGTTTTGAALVELVNGDTAGLNLGANLRGIELVTQTISVGGKTLNAGQLLLSLDGNAVLGGLSVKAGDVAVLSLITSGNLSTGTASMLMRAADVGLTGGGESLDALALVQRASVAPTVTVDASVLAYTENDLPTLIAPNASVADADSANFSGGSLTIYLSSNGTANDRLAIRNEGTGATQINLNGNDVKYGSVIIGSFSGGEDGSTPLVISLNANATVAATQALLRNITYANVSEAPSTLPRTASVVLTDGNGGVSNSAARTISVTAVNDPPTTTPASATGDEDTVIPITLNGSDVDGTIASFTVTSMSAQITLYLDAAKTTAVVINTAYPASGNALTLYIAPNADWNGSASFNYVATDDLGLASTSATANVTVNAVNDPPVAVADTATAVEAGGIGNGTAGTNPTGNVLSNDTDVDSGDTQTVTAYAFGASPGTLGSGLAGAYGTLTLNANGSYSYVVDNTHAAVQALRTSSDTLTEVFSYTMQDTAGAPSSSTLTITIEGRNDDPVAVADSQAVDEKATLNQPAATGILANDTDVDGGDTKTVSAVSFGATAGTVGNELNGTYGRLTLNADGSYNYTADLPAALALLESQSASDVFTYTVQDTAGATSSSTLTFNLTGKNDAPVAVADTASAVEAGGASNGTAGTNPTGNVLSNDTDVDSGDTQTVTAVAFGVTPGIVGIGLAGAYGTLTLNADGSYGYVVDNTHAAVQALRTSTDTLTEVFSYTLQDSAGATSSSTLTITIEGRNDDPVAVADVATAVEAGGLNNGTAGINPTGNVLSNDTDVDSGDTQTVTAYAFGASPGTLGSGLAGAYGTLTMSADGSYSYVVDNTHAAVQALRTSTDTLTEVFSYTMQDTAGAPSSSTLIITITGSNDTPLAGADTATAVEAGGTANGTLGINPTGNVLANDTDADSGDTQTVAAVSFGATPGVVGIGLAGAFGTLTLNADGSYSYVVDNNNATVQALRNSSDTLTEVFSYTLQDTAGATSSSTLTITITGSNDAPVITTNSTQVVVEEQPVNIVVSAIDVESDTLSFSITGGADAAWFTIDASTGLLSMKFVPDYETPKDANLDNIYEVTVTVSDGNGGLHTLSIQVVVTDKVEVVTAPPSPPTPTPTDTAADKESETDTDKPQPVPVVPESGLAKVTSPSESSDASVTVLYQAATATTSAQMVFDHGQVNRNHAATGPTLVTLNQMLGGLSSDARALQMLQNSLDNGNFLQQLDQLQDAIRQQLNLDKNVVASTLAVSTGLSVGYVIWLVRGGVLLSSLLTSLPAWRLIDPLPILGHLGTRHANDDEDDSLEGMLKKSNERIEPVLHDTEKVTP